MFQPSGTVTMKLQALHVLALQGFFGVMVVSAVREAVGNLGGSITLPSGADPTWELSSIEWSIFKNNTWIATYRKGEGINIERVPRYKGRLGLNITTGDLTIHRLTKEDNMEFNVDFISTSGKDDSTKIRLTVNRQLQQPTIQKVFSMSTEQGCWITLNCSSPDEGINYSWHVTHSNLIIVNQTDAYGNSKAHLIFPDNTIKGAKVNCTSSTNTGSSSSTFSVECESIKYPTSNIMDTPQRCYHSPCFVAGLITGVIVTSLLWLFRGKIKEAWETLKGKLCT